MSMENILTPPELEEPWRYSYISTFWDYTKDGDPFVREIFDRHYSRYHYKDGRKPLIFVGPGEKIVLIAKTRDAIFIWRKFRSMDNQEGINCAVFRNEGNARSSDMILDAMQIAWARWPGERLYTYVNPRKIKSPNPGYCFKKAGWRTCGETKARKLLILEVRP